MILYGTLQRGKNNGAIFLRCDIKLPLWSCTEETVPLFGVKK